MTTHYLAALASPACCVGATLQGEHLAIGTLRGLEGTPEMHTTGRPQLRAGYLQAQGTEPSPAELQILGAIADLESNYGRGWSGPMVGSNNWGAITCGASPDESGACPPGCSPNKDSSPYSGEYVTCFRRWATPEEGAAGLVKLLYKWPEVVEAIQAGDIDEVSWRMRQRSYFLGTDPDPRKAAATHAGALDRKVGEIVEALGEPRAAFRGGPAAPGGGSNLASSSTASVIAKGALLLAGLAALFQVGQRIGKR